MPPPRPRIRLPRLLDRREPEDGLQGALSGIGAPDRQSLGAVHAGSLVAAKARRSEMTIGVLSSTLFGDMFGTAAMRAAFGELGFLARCTEVEAALARAQARLGIVPTEAAEAISEAAAAVVAPPEMFDLA